MFVFFLIFPIIIKMIKNFKYCLPKKYTFEIRNLLPETSIKVVDRRFYQKSAIRQHFFKKNIQIL